VWDLLAARRARALGVGLLSGGYEKEELERAGHTAFTKTRRISSVTWMKWEFLENCGTIRLCFPFRPCGRPLAPCS